MNERILELARQAANGMLSYDAEGDWRLSEKEVEYFAELVAAAEREACAKVVENYCGAWDDEGYALTRAIRARGE